MPNREKLIKGLEMHKKRACAECPYEDATLRTDNWCIAGIHNDCIALLKEQEEKDEKILAALDGYRMCDEMSKNAYENLTKLIRSEQREVE